MRLWSLLVSQRWKAKGMSIKDFLADKALDAAALVGAAGPLDNPVENIGAAVGLVGAAVGGALRKRSMRIEAEYIA